MEIVRKRIGKDERITWWVKTNHEYQSLVGRNLSLECVTPHGNTMQMPL